MDILVTGAFGWTAEPTVRALHEAGHRVVALDLPEVACPPGVEAYVSKVVSDNVVRYEIVDDAMSTVNAVVHFAVAVGHNDYENAEVPFATNVRGTYNVFEAARRHGLGKIVLIKLGGGPSRLEGLRPS